MPGRLLESELPFWIDEPNPYGQTELTRPGIEQWLAAWVSCSSALFVWTAIFTVSAAFAFKYPLVWIFIAFEVCVLIFSVLPILARWRRRIRLPKATLIQQLAKEKTGADIIGSALHTAGHPLLRFDQPVVLALKGDELSIYSYGSPLPIDSIQVTAIQTVQTVVFDDGGVPHVDAIDSTAQALQLTLSWRGNPSIWSFRRMYKVRAIGWYQAIQSARLLSKHGSPEQ